MDIAKRWFGLRDDSNVKTVIADGLEFMRLEIERGRSHCILYVDELFSVSSI